MSEYIHKRQNVTVLLYHLVFPAKYRRAVFDEQVDTVLREVCLEIEKRYEVKFVEIGVDKDQVHFLSGWAVTKALTMGNCSFPNLATAPSPWGLGCTVPVSR